MKQIDKYHLDVLRNTGSTLGAAIRNAQDPADPGHFDYAEMIPERLAACFQYAIEHNIPMAQASELILQGINGQVQFLTSGFLTDLRETIQTKEVNND